jgi:hypothetical protein
MNSGAEVWQGEKGEVFSDGTTDSDKSEYQVEVDLQQKGGSKAGTVAGPSAGAVWKRDIVKILFLVSLNLRLWLGKSYKIVSVWGDRRYDWVIEVW